MAAAALSATLLGTMALATSADATQPQSGDTRATAVIGNISRCPAGTTTLLYNATGAAGNDLVGTNVTRKRLYVDLLFASSLNGAEITAYIKGGDAYNVYAGIVAGPPTGDSEDLHAPLNRGGIIPAISHLLICQTTSRPPQFDTPPEMYLGYADDFHGVSGGFPFLPSPWKGDPSVVYVGCSGAECGGTGAGKFDSGAIRIKNMDTDNPLTLERATVAIGPCTYDPWPTLLPRTAGVGLQLVLAQSGILGPPQPAPCDAPLEPSFRAETNFDTSERAGDSRDPRMYVCAPEVRHKPVITLVFEDGVASPGVDADDVTVTVIDEGMILNTGGTDSFACTGRDEATPWTGPLAYTPPPAT